MTVSVVHKQLTIVCRSNIHKETDTHTDRQTDTVEVVSVVSYTSNTYSNSIICHKQTVFYVTHIKREIETKTHRQADTNTNTHTDRLTETDTVEVICTHTMHLVCLHHRQNI